VVEKNWNNFEKNGKQGRPCLKSKNFSDLGHFEIKFGKKGDIFYKKSSVVSTPTNVDSLMKIVSNYFIFLTF